MNNLVWLADNDKEALLALIACQHHTCDDCSFAKYPACDAIGGYSKWLWGEHVDDNNKCDATNKYADVDSRKKLEKDAWEFVSGAWHAGRNFELGKTPDGWDSDELIALLDRQAAITRHEVLTQPDERDEQIAELKFERDLWLKRYEQSHEYAMNVESDCEKLTRELAKSSQDDYWDDCSTCEEIDHLQRENMNLANDLGACMAERDEFKRMYDKECKAYNLTRQAYDFACTRADNAEHERDELRKHLGAVLDAAQEIRRIGALYGVD